MSTDFFCTEAFHHKLDYPGLFPGSADDAQSGNAKKFIRCTNEQRMFMPGDVRHANSIQIVNRRSQANCVSDIAGASFKSLWRAVVEGFSNVTS